MIANDTITALLAAIRREPHDRLHRLVLSDALEEAGDKRAAIVRTIQPKVADVARRLWPGAKFVHVCSTRPNDRREEVHSKHGGFLMSVRDLCDMMERRTLLVDPAIAEATEIERGLAVLRLFAEHEGK